MLWEQQDQQAYIHFPQILTQTELVPYIIKNEHTSLQYRDPTSFDTTHFELINLDHNFITDYSETSDNRPYITSINIPETTPEEQTSIVYLNLLDKIQYNQNKMILSTFSKIKDLTK